MNEKRLYSYTGIFNTPNEIIHAAKKIAEKGFKNYDIHTPYPLHGMEKAMKLKPSKIGYVSLVLGLSGAISAILTLFWMAAIDYKLVIGGKPFFSFPAYIPITFEITVLSASVITVLVMLFIFFKLPNNSHPLHATDYMKKVSSDKYGVSIQADDPLFNEEEVKSLLKSLNASDITPIYFNEEEINYKHVLLEPKFVGFLVLVALFTSATTYFTLNKLMYMVPFNWMDEQAKVIPQQPSKIFADGFGMRQPVNGTVARGQIPFLYKNNPDEAAKDLVNPLLPSVENLKLGEQKFNIYCSPCHGYHAEGDSRLQGQFPNPPSLHSEKVRNWSDGRIFYVITEGQNIMPSYATQLTPEERWAVILYIRALQRSLNAKESDLK
ncbi:quinol:electron acceptor oxidoreductase subunit ActD [Melioribacteraceae bacterium 4301-Me]|uniref:quinol:electron acceptor oxidoreductase subunit ActD n=1 Tax=Pyranulibacter aquaticus TaxID=3163344 RepID=UPI0035954073